MAGSPGPVPPWAAFSGPPGGRGAGCGQPRLGPASHVHPRLARGGPPRPTLTPRRPLFISFPGPSSSPRGGAGAGPVLNKHKPGWSAALCSGLGPSSPWRPVCCLPGPGRVGNEIYRQPFLYVTSSWHQLCEPALLSPLADGKPRLEKYRARGHPACRDGVGSGLKPVRSQRLPGLLLWGAPYVLPPLGSSVLLARSSAFIWGSTGQTLSQEVPWPYIRERKGAPTLRACPFCQGHGRGQWRMPPSYSVSLQSGRNRAAVCPASPAVTVYPCGPM